MKRERGRQQITEQSIIGLIPKVEVEESLIRVLLCKDQELPAELQTKTVLDAFTGKEHGHIIRHCLWRLEDEEAGGKGPSLNMLEDQYVSNDDSTLWDDSGYSDHTSYNVLTDQHSDEEIVTSSDIEGSIEDIDNLNC